MGRGNHTWKSCFGCLRTEQKPVWVLMNLCGFWLGFFLDGKRGFAAELVEAQPLVPGPGWPWASYPVSAPPYLHCCGSAQGEEQSNSGTYCPGSLGCGKEREGRLHLFLFWEETKCLGMVADKCKPSCPGRLSLWKLKLTEALVWQQAWWNHSLLLPSYILIIKEFLMEKTLH